MSRPIAQLAWLIPWLIAGCLEERPAVQPAAVFDGDIQTLLRQRCQRCHDADDDAGAGFRVDSYLGVLGCPDSSPALRAIDRGDSGPVLVTVLDRDDHAGLLNAAERARLSSWVERSAPLRKSAVHAPGILNTHTPDWHGKLAAADRFGALLQADHPHVCGRCHAGAPVAPATVTHPAPSATACTTCHTQPAGVLACSTCHGDGAAAAFPPREACQFGAPQPDAHRAHLESTRLSERRLLCSTCHPSADARLDGTHANGVVDLAFDPALAGPDATYDASTGQCTVACHNHHGARTMPAFHQPGPMTCGDCHGAPPADHYAGRCDRCHSEVSADASALRTQHLHMNGHVDLGNGSGTCAACHGQGDDPMPPTASHQLHRATALTLPITCADCHRVPSTVASPGHIDQGRTHGADVTFGARANARGQQATYSDGTCRNIACHGAGLPEGIERALVWDAPATGTCSGCHGLPPGKDHVTDNHCATLICHGAEVSAAAPLAITPSGRTAHINGQLDTGMR